jgi:UDPglucose--hexose-1-phosphate uridylyltransferase
VHGATRSDGCPFCEGAERDTPPELDALRPHGTDPDTPGWLVRVVPNKFPALAPEEGVHEVIIGSPRHVVDLAGLRPDELAPAVRMWARRLGVVAADPRGLWPFLFLNQGAAAGASLQHTHAQLVGMRFAPPRLAARARVFADAARSPLLDDLEAAPGQGRVVGEHGPLVVWAPAVPLYSAGVRIAPAEPAPRWDDHLDVAALVHALHHAVVGMRDRLGAVALNLWLHQARPGDDTGSFHWHLEVVPRLGTLAGLELGSGVLAAAHSPADVARRLAG